MSVQFIDDTAKERAVADEAAVAHAKTGDPEWLRYIFGKYEPLVRQKARSYYLTGGDRMDLLQEGRIGLLSAIHDYKPELGLPFQGFASLCITRRLISAVKHVLRKKRRFTLSARSLDAPIGADEDGDLQEFLESATAPDPEEIYLSRETVSEVFAGLNSRLSPLELRVLRSYMNGQGYKEISVHIHCPPKVVDNALQRAKRKLYEIIQQSKDSSLLDTLPAGSRSAAAKLRMRKNSRAQTAKSA
ncbi:MAG: sigma-70 family RNA polymerase sigma factor [Armatimonadetes bacterium]|nr:sigma-70 family RNA polymerase sigma factor [Armatimonadota bacterium]